MHRVGYGGSRRATPPGQTAPLRRRFAAMFTLPQAAQPYQQAVVGRRFRGPHRGIWAKNHSFLDDLGVFCGVIAAITDPFVVFIWHGNRFYVLARPKTTFFG